MIKFKIKELMDAAGMNIQTFANKTGVSRTTISAFYNGHSNGIQLDTLEKFCRVLKATPNDLIELSPDEYTVIVDVQKPIHNQIRASAIKTEVLKDAREKNCMYNADKEEKQFFIFNQGIVIDGYGLMLIIGAPANVVRENENNTSVFDDYKWFDSLSFEQQNSICQQAAEIFLFNYYDKQLPNHVLAVVSTNASGGRVIDFVVDTANKSLVINPD